jgi:mannosyltransferase OCH1-like enzyme
MIPKKIYQTFYTRSLPDQIVGLTKRMLDNNPGYEYYFFDDDMMREFVKNNSDKEMLDCFDSLNVGAAKADLWRYLILFKNGGVYLDIDSEIYGKLDDFIKDEDEAIVSREGHYGKFVQWCLMFAPNHPVLKICLEKCVENIKQRKTNNIIDLTGPTVFSESINEYSKILNIDLWSTNDIELNKMLNYNSLKLRVYSKDYHGYCNFKHIFHTILEAYNMQNSKIRHWTYERKIFN